MMEIIETLKDMLRKAKSGLNWEDDQEIRKVYLKEIAALTEAISSMEWVKVSDRLPGHDHCVLVSHLGIVEIAFYFNEDWTSLCSGRLKYVTHWRALPLPPAPGGE
jgi:hypothetical protein